MIRTRSKTDANHKEISIAFERLGWSVLDIHQIPNSADILIGKWMHCIVIEIKDGSKPPSNRKLTPGEIKFKDRWRGDYRIVTCLQDVLDIDKEYKNKVLAS